MSEAIFQPPRTVKMRYHVLRPLIFSITRLLEQCRVFSLTTVSTRAGSRGLRRVASFPYSLLAWEIIPLSTHCDASPTSAWSKESRNVHPEPRNRTSLATCDESISANIGAAEPLEGGVPWMDSNRSRAQHAQ